MLLVGEPAPVHTRWVSSPTSGCVLDRNTCMGLITKRRDKIRKFSGVLFVISCKWNTHWQHTR